MNTRWSMIALAALAGGCNAYDDFRIAGYQQESFSNQADILFVIDNSSSMTQEGLAVAENFGRFLETFAPEGISPPTDPDLTNDVDRYIDFIQNPAANLNFHLGITTTEVSKQWGTLIGTPEYVSRRDTEIADAFNANLLCGAVCLETGDIPANLGECPPGLSPSGNCANDAAGAVEEGIEAVFMAMCRGVDNPPPACFDPWWQSLENGYTLLPEPYDPDDDTVNRVDYFSEIDIATNSGFLRANSTVIPIIVTDEGDTSRRIINRDGSIFPYNELFSQFDNRMSWAVIGPNVDCNPSVSAWSVNRYKRLVTESNGRYIDLETPDSRGNCNENDFGASMSQVGELLRAIGDTFPLQTRPVPDTILVQVENRIIQPATQRYDADLGLTVYEDGWSYRAVENVVMLHGDAVPDFSERVSVWYEPSEGATRPLPF